MMGFGGILGGLVGGLSFVVEKADFNKGLSLAFLSAVLEEDSSESDELSPWLEELLDPRFFCFLLTLDHSPPTSAGSCDLKRDALGGGVGASWDASPSVLAALLGSSPAIALSAGSCALKRDPSLFAVPPNSLSVLVFEGLSS